MVHDLARKSRDADAPIEARGAQPQDAALLVRLTLPPEADVVPAAGTLSDVLLEGEILRPPPCDEVSTHGSARVRPVEENAPRVGESGPPGDAVGQGPAGVAHRGDDVAAGSDDRHVDRVRRYSFGRVGEAGESEILGQARVTPPDRRQHAVGDARVRWQKQRDEEESAQDPEPRSHPSGILRSGT